MTVYSAPGFLVPDDPDSGFAPAEQEAARVASFPAARPRTPDAEGIVYRDPAMLEVVQRALRIARSDASVLVHGESGTGKEVIARYIHRNSPRAAGPFVAVNCAAIPEQLLESELFGHERGAFSGASGQRIGKLEAAQNGTILLDEISEMDRRLQAKLLRALQEREVDRIGGRAPVRVNVRIIATTNKDLEQEVARLNFREDLYFRLNVVGIHLPNLRDRKQDIPALAAHFIEKYRWETGRAQRQLSPNALSALMAHNWPGNVRELENTIHRALVLTADTVIGAKALEVGPSSNSTQFAAGEHPTQSRVGHFHSRLPAGDQPLWSDEADTCAPPIDDAAPHLPVPHLRAGDRASSLVGRPLHLVERDAIIGTLQLTAGNRTRTAAILGLSIRALRNKISLYTAQGIAVPNSSSPRPSPAGNRSTGISPSGISPSGISPSGISNVRTP